MSGSTVTLDRSDHVHAFHSTTNPGNSAKYCPLKTVNMHSLSLSSWKQVEKRLGLYISSGKVNDYYEAVFSEMVRENTLSLKAVTFDPARWYEIDTLTDLDRAELLFPVGLKSSPAELHTFR